MRLFRGPRDRRPVGTDEKFPKDYLSDWRPGYDYLRIYFDGTKVKGGKETCICLEIEESDVKALFFALINRYDHRSPSRSLALCLETVAELPELARACQTLLEELLQAQQRNELELKELRNERERLRKRPKIRREK